LATDMLESHPRTIKMQILA